MPTKRSSALIVILAVFALVAAACGDDDSTAAEPEPAPADDAAAEEPAAGSLVGVCPDPLVVQTSWFPEPDHAYTYNMIGTGGTVDAANGRYSGPLGDTGIQMVVRAGGPYIGNQSDTANFFADRDIHMAYVDTTDAISESVARPTMAVFAPNEVGPQILMWDPDKLRFDSVEEIRDSGVPVLYFEGSAYMDYLLHYGLLDPDQIDGSYDGSPTRMIAEDVVQQGFATSEPYQYENEIEGFMRPTDSLLVHDMGYDVYQSALSIRTEDLEDLRPCLEQVIPMFQQSLIDYFADPEPLNVRLDEVVKELDSFWTSSIEGHNDATRVMRDRGLVTDGDNGTFGDFDEVRLEAFIEKVLPIYEAQGLDSFDPDVSPSDIATNEFLDPSKSLGF